MTDQQNNAPTPRTADVVTRATEVCKDKGIKASVEYIISCFRVQEVELAAALAREAKLRDMLEEGACDIFELDDDVRASEWCRKARVLLAEKGTP